MITSGFFNSKNGDRKYTAVQISKYFEGILTDGVLAAVGDKLQVVASSGMTISVKSGRGLIRACWIDNSSAISLTHEKSEVYLDRIDSVVLMCDESDAVRGGDIYIKKGTPAESPEAPSLLESLSKKEICLADVYIPKQTTEITQANITDQRPGKKCGWVTGLVEQVDTAGITEQQREIFQDMMDYYTGKLGDEPATNLQTQILDLTAQLGEMTLRVAELEPEIATLTPLNGFSLTNVNKPATATRQGREVHIQIGVEQPSTANRIFTQLPQGMYDSNTHLVPGINGNNGDVYPISIDRYGRVSFNGAAIKDVYINATFTLEG